jgi:hypothetical protein
MVVMTPQNWPKLYAGQMNKKEVRLEAVRDRYNRHWGQYAVIDTATGLTLATFDYKKAKAVL